MCTELAVGESLTLRVHPKEGQIWEAKLNHTFNESQISWFKDGSALNTMARTAEAQIASGANSKTDL